MINNLLLHINMCRFKLQIYNLFVLFIYCFYSVYFGEVVYCSNGDEADNCNSDSAGSDSYFDSSSSDGTDSLDEDVVDTDTPITMSNTENSNRLRQIAQFFRLTMLRRRLQARVSGLNERRNSSLSCSRNNAGTPISRRAIV